ncbi:MAG: oligosaccharide flippase family protein [Bacteroidia bacterium]|nr:oligosaccharide flippase family protein [Bacteroidia bacterium]MDW8345631.1 oligosaccharide flippase family protein [Bacteroidia bacterium]
MSLSLKKLLSQTAIYGISSILGRLLNYLLVPLYTRVLAPSEYGVVTDLMAYVSFMLVLYSYGMETTFFRFSSQREYNPNDVYGTILTLLSATSIIITVILIIFARPLAHLLSYSAYPQYIIYLAVILALDTISAIQFAWLRKQEKAITFALIRLMNIFSNIILNIYFVAYLKKGVEYIFITNVICSLLTTVSLLPITLPKKFTFQHKWIKSMLIYGSPLLVSGLAGMINENLDRILLKRYLPKNFYPGLTNDEVVGIYGACYKLSIFVSLVVQAFRYGAEPFYFKKSVDNDAKQIYSKIMDYFVPAVFFICVVVTAFLNEIGLMIGKNFRSGLHIVPILLIANAFLGIYYNLSVWYKLTQKTEWALYISLIGAGLTILINLVGIPVWGMMASVYATLACYAVMMVLSYYWGQKFYPIPYNRNSLIFYCIFSIGMIVFLAYLPKWDCSTLIQFWIKAGTVLLYVGIFVGYNRFLMRG